MGNYVWYPKLTVSGEPHPELWVTLLEDTDMEPAVDTDGAIRLRVKLRPESWESHRAALAHLIHSALGAHEAELG